MLCEFQVKNFRCIKGTGILSLVAADGLSEHRDSLIRQEDGISFLPLAVIYGPNGGGKSTVLDALHSLWVKVMSPVVAAENMRGMVSDSFNSVIFPFLFDEESYRSATEFTVVFRTEGYEYEYHLSVKNQMVERESLYHKRIPKGRYTCVFQREGDGVFSLSKSLGKVFGRAEEQVISSSLPLLSYLSILNGRHPVIRDVMGWFGNGIRFLDYRNSFREHYMDLPQDGEMKDRILQLLDAMGMDITDYRLERVGKDPDGSERFRIMTEHRVGARRYELELHQESSGTVKIFNSLPYIVSALQDGSTLVVDEFDAKLHPALLAYVLRLFSDLEINSRGAQLLFTSQDVETMSSENFRRDEIWFAAKNGDQESQLYALSDFRSEKGEKVRKDGSYSKQYMEGRYGADPFFKRFVGWRDR